MSQRDKKCKAEGRFILKVPSELGIRNYQEKYGKCSFGNPVAEQPGKEHRPYNHKSIFLNTDVTVQLSQQLSRHERRKKK